MAFYRVGVDVGGTNTDAAILDISACDTASRGVFASYKTFTTTDITSGIETAVKAILEASQVDLNRIIAVTIGTTHFINAVVEANARELSRVAVLRLCGPFTRQISPFADFPPKLRSILDGGSFFLDGGLEFNGEQILPLDYEQIRQATRHLIHQGVRSAAIVGVFSPIDHVSPQEETCRKIMLEVDSDLDITISRDIGPVGLLERENATILNSAILRTARRLIKGFKRAIAVLGLQCPLYLSRNDGTIIAADEAANLPITTFASGPTNSMIGAAFLAGYGRRSVSTNNHANGVKTNGDSSESQVLVVDIGGTTTDVCALLPSGFPRLAPGFTEVGGVRTAFSMPEVRSVGLGGGSIVQVDAEAEHVTLGPASVGNLLTQQALVFGGRTMTATDMVAAMGKTELGHPSLVSEIPAIVVEAARKRIKKILEDVIEQMKFSAAPVHVLLVGGGALLVTESLEGVERCIRPMHSEAANAVGAAISEVSGDVDLIEALKGRSEKAVVAAACEKAIGLAIERGATADDVRIVQITKTPLQYVNNGAIRIQVRAVGKLRTPDVVRLPETNGTGSAEDDNEPEARPQVEPDIAVDVPHQLQVGMDLATYRPEVKQGVWYVSEVDIELISTGCGILGTGGGGPTHYEALRCNEILRTGGKGRMRIICPESLKDDDLIGFGSWYGAPGVSNERIVNGGEIDVGVDTLLKVLGGQKLNGFLLDEVGGGNGLSIFSTAVNYNLPVVDGDTMGRAFPAMYHSTTSVYGHPLTPCCITDCRGVISILMGADSPDRVEKVLRSTAIELGLGCAVCTNPLSGKSIKSHAVPRTLSLAWYLGRAIHLARRKKTSYIEAVSHIGKARLIFAGKIIDVQRNISDGYTKGHVLLAPLSLEEQEGVKTDSHSNRQADKHMLIPFQNEYLYAALTDPTGKEADQIICTVPELISVLGQDGEAIGSQDLKYGLRVSVIAMPAHPLWKTPQGLRVGGPQGFGLEIPFTPEPSLDILTATAGDLRQLLDCGKCTSVELAQLYLDHTARHNHAGMKLHAITTTAPVQMLLEEARALDLERRKSRARSPLHGIPATFKDFFLTPSFGLGTTCGSFALKGLHASEDAAIVTSLRDARCIVLVLANLSARHQFLAQTSYVRGGVDPNDKWLGHSTPGGSSSGSAVGTAAGFSAFSIGSESDRSIVQPAIRAALYSMKGSVGAIDMEGTMSGGMGFDSAGPLAKSVQDCADVMNVLLQEVISAHI